VAASRAAALAAAALLATGCGGGGGGGGGNSSSDPKAVEAAATEFAKAFGAGDGSKACDTLTSAAQADWVKRVQVFAPARDCPTAIKRVHDAAGPQVTTAFSTATVSDVKVNGDTATVRLTATGSSTLVRLERQDGSWRLMAVPGF
jgi:Tfp pilus assembly protein PilW